MQAIEGGDWRWVEGKKEMDKAMAETWEFQAIIDELELKQSQS